MTKSAITRGVHHVGLTVPNITATKRFFVELLGFEQVAERPDYPAVFVSDGTVLITLWQALEPAEARPFDRQHAVGLHHLALRLSDPQALDRLYPALQAYPGVELEFAPEPLGQTGLRHLMCAIPGGVRLELVAEGG